VLRRAFWVRRVRIRDSCSVIVVSITTSNHRCRFYWHMSFMTEGMVEEN
jgi:hypothetical protein